MKKVGSINQAQSDDFIKYKDGDEELKDEELEDEEYDEEIEVVDTKRRKLDSDNQSEEDI